MSIIKGTNQIVAGFGGTKRSIGEVYFSQSALATDNSGALPLFTGETIASANTIYPDFYNWVLSHTELQCTSAEYEASLTTYGECAKYVVINSTPTRYKWENPLTGVLYTLSRNPAVGDLAYDVTGNNSWPITEASSTAIVVPTFADNKPLSYVEEVAGTSASIRLPKLSNYIKAANTAEGIKNIEAGLPNITGVKNSVQLRSSSDSSQSGALYSVSSSASSYGGSGNWAAIKLGFDASRSSAVYGKSSTVTPASTTLYPWVVAYTAAIPASMAQAAEFQQALSGKADTNLGNLSAAGKDLASGLGMPSSRYIDLTLGASDSTYTAPANGFITLRYNTNANFSYCHLYNDLTGYGTTEVYALNGLGGMYQSIEVRGGSQFSIAYSGLEILIFRFIYAEGAE